MTRTLGKPSSQRPRRAPAAPPPQTIPVLLEVGDAVLVGGRVLTLVEVRDGEAHFGVVEADLHDGFVV